MSNQILINPTKCNDQVILDIDNISNNKISPLKIYRTFKIIVVGDTGVGKTCLTHRFCQGRFPCPTEATVGVDFREKSIQIGNESVKLQVWDTAGQERFRRSMISHYYRNVHAIVYVYDVTRRETFEGLVNWIKECSEHIPVHSIPSVLVGNKCDAPIHNVQVHSRVAHCFAEFHCMEFYETSAADDEKSSQIQSIFVMLACRLMVLYGSNAPIVERTDRQLIELKPTIIDRGDSCYC